MDSGKNFQIDMCHGPLFGKIILFSIPLIITNLLQLLFHAADLVVLGQYADPKAMAALIAITLRTARDASRLVWKKIRIHGDILKEMLKIGLPAGIQGSFFSISNVIIQS